MEHLFVNEHQTAWRWIEVMLENMKKSSINRLWLYLGSLKFENLHQREELTVINGVDTIEGTFYPHCARILKKDGPWNGRHHDVKPRQRRLLREEIHRVLGFEEVVSLTSHIFGNKLSPGPSIIPSWPLFSAWRLPPWPTTTQNQARPHTTHKKNKESVASQKMKRRSDWMSE